MTTVAELDGPAERSPCEPSVEDKQEWLNWCMRYFRTLDREWCVQRWIVTAQRGQLPPNAEVSNERHE